MGGHISSLNECYLGDKGLNDFINDPMPVDLDWWNYIGLQFMQNKEVDCQGHCLLSKIEKPVAYFHSDEFLKHLLSKSSVLII